MLRSIDSQSTPSKATLSVPKSVLLKTSGAWAVDGSSDKLRDGHQVGWPAYWMTLFATYTDDFGGSGLTFNDEKGWPSLMSAWHPIGPLAVITGRNPKTFDFTNPNPMTLLKSIGALPKAPRVICIKKLEHMDGVFRKTFKNTQVKIATVYNREAAVFIDVIFGGRLGVEGVSLVTDHCYAMTGVITGTQMAVLKNPMGEIFVLRDIGAANPGGTPGVSYAAKVEVPVEALTYLMDGMAYVPQ